jgi:hypothetical protein
LSTPPPSHNTVPTWLKDVTAIGLLTVLTLFFFWRLFAPNPEDRLAFPRGDFTDQYFPLRHFVATTLATGELPFWNPHIYGGQPGLADPQAATFYPPALLNALLWGADYPLFALEMEVVAHLWWAMVGAYLFIRFGLKLGIFPALFGTIVFSFGGYLTGFPLQQVTILETVAWLPWLLFSIHLTIEGTTSYKRRVSGAIGALVTGCAVLAGHPQSVLYLVYLAVAYTVFLLWRANGTRWQGWLERGWVVALMLGLGVGSAAIQLLPTFAFIEESTRETLTYEFTSSGQTWAELLEILLPKVVGATPLYVGISTLVIAGIGFFTHTQQAEKRFWGGVAVVSLLLSLGGNSILYDALYLGAPGFGSVRSQERILIWWAWGISLLAAWGISALGEAGSAAEVSNRRQTYIHRLGWALPFFLLPLLAIWWFRALAISQFSVNVEVFTSFFDRYTFFLVMLVFSWGLLAWIHRTAATPVALIGLMVLVIVDLFTITRAPHLGASYESTLPRENEVVQTLFTKDSLGRIATVGSPIPQNNDGMYWGFNLLGGNEPLRLANSQTFFENVPAVRQFQLLNVTHIVADINLAENEPTLYEHVVASDSGAASHLHRIVPSFPYVWWVGEVEQVEGRNTLYRRLQANDLDPYRTAIIDKEIAPLASDSDTAIDQATIAIESTHPGYARLRVQHSANGSLLLLIAEPNTAGWEIEIDGQPARRERLNALNMGVVVPAGEHVVTFTYHQPRWEEGLWITGFSLLGILLMALIPVGLAGTKKIIP